MPKIDFPFRRGEWYPVSSLLKFSRQLLEMVRINKIDTKYLINDDNNGEKYKTFSEELFPFLLWNQSLEGQFEFQLTDTGSAADVLVRPHGDQANLQGIQITCAYPDWDAVLRPEKKKKDRKNPGYIDRLEREELDRRGFVFRGCEIDRENNTSAISVAHTDYTKTWEFGIHRVLKQKFENIRYRGKNFILLIAARRVRFDLAHTQEAKFTNKLADFIRNQIERSPFHSIYVIDTSQNDTVWKIFP